MADKYIEMELKKIRKKAIRPAVRKDLDDLIDYCEACERGHKALEDRTDTKFSMIGGVAVVERKYR